MRLPRALALLVPVWAACAASSPHSDNSAVTGAKPPAAPPVRAEAPGIDAGVTAPPPDALTQIHNGRTIEVACNGKDDDGDGLVDVLLPVGPNACATGAKGACGAGFAVCDGGKRTCLTPPPMPEVFDGIDNDCNGIVDDVATGDVRPRAVILAPRYAWSDAAPDLANVTTSLTQAGIPFERPKTGTDWASLASLDDATLAIIPGYLLGAVMGPVREKLEAFVTRGGVLVVFKPIAESAHPEALSLAGLRGGARRRDIEELRFEGALTPATRSLDSAEERSLGINARGAKDGVEVWTYEADAQTEVLATAIAASGPVGAAVTRRKFGRGSVYAVGHDLASFGAPRCYMNCFAPAGDVLRLFLEGALREGSAGHVAILHTMPAQAASVLVLTHDVNAPESQHAGAWGEPAALQFAKVEREHGVRATYNVMTDYRGRQFNAKTVRELCALGMCPAGIQGVTHVPFFARMPDGMIRDSEKSPWRCKETLETYSVPSLCGEVLLSKQLAQSAGGGVPRTWRSTSLAVHAQLFDVLAGAGIRFDTTFGIGDLPFNVPLDLATTGIQQRRFHKRPLLEFPLACDDGIDVGQGESRQRVELQASTEDRFRSIWDYILLQNARNGSLTTLRMSAAKGTGMTPDNVQARASILGRLLDHAAASNVAVRSVEEVGDFWRARLDAQLEARFAEGTGYSGSITIGKATAPGLTLEFGDVVTSFECPACGETKLAGKLVTLVTALPPGTKATFTAKTTR